MIKYNYNLYIDNRESKIINSNLLPNAIIKPLDIGDFNITCMSNDSEFENKSQNETEISNLKESNYHDVEMTDSTNTSVENIIYIIERKTISDLLGSIKDGRYYEQKTRALTLYGNTKFAYILECSTNGINWMSKSKDNTCIQSAIINTMIRDNVPFFVSNSINETINIVENIYNKFLDRGSDYYTQSVHNTLNKELSTQYKSCILMQSKKCKTKKNPRLVAEMQLSQIPSITMKNASDLLTTLNINTFPQFVKLYISSNNVIDQIKNIKGFGKTKVNEIIKFMDN